MITYFVKHPTAANLLMIVMLAIGLLSLGGLRRETLPDASPVEVKVTVAFPGLFDVALQSATKSSSVKGLNPEIELLPQHRFRRSKGN